MSKIEIRTAEEILKDAIKNKSGKRGKGYTDNKYFIQMDEIINLIKAGARILHCNDKRSGAFHFTVIYEEHTFISYKNGLPPVLIITRP